MKSNDIVELKEALDIVDVISSVVDLKKTGKDFKGLCPFHNEKTPSFTVSGGRQLFHCFGCGESGDVFSFVQKYRKVDFKEALRRLQKYRLQGTTIKEIMTKILVLDIETTGFLKEGGSIVEVGIVELNLESGEIVTLFDSVCREDILDGSHRVSPKGWIFRNSTLTVEEVRDAPRFEELKRVIQSHIDFHPLGATAFNRSFDFDFLESRGVKFGVKLPCPMQLATPICRLPSANPRYPDYKWPKVEEAWSHFFPDEEYVELHRGADDARHEARIVLALYRIGAFRLVDG